MRSMKKLVANFGWEQEPAVERRVERGAGSAGSVPVASASPAEPLRKAAFPWHTLRDPPSQRDSCLSAMAAAWRDGLPVHVRPEQLCATYPRIANRLALSWKDKTLSRLVLASLLADKRGGRQGFPPDIAAEIATLNTFL